MKIFGRHRPVDRDTQQQMNIRIDTDLYDRLKSISADEERTLAQTIRFALRRYADQMGPAAVPTV